jgi:hypothetical protein
LLAIAMAPCYPALLSPESLHCLPIHNRVRLLRLLAIAMAPYCPTLLLPESLHFLRMYKVVRLLRFYATNCVPLSPTPKFNIQHVLFPLMLNSFTCGSCISSTVSSGIASSDPTTALNPPTVKMLLFPSDFSVALPKRSSVSCCI